MFLKPKTVVNKDIEVLENIKRELEIQLGKRGVAISRINMKMNPDNISLSILINSSKRLA